MNVLQRLIYKEVVSAVSLVTVAFLGLFFFFDLIDELPSIGHPAPGNVGVVYQLRHALAFVTLLIPNHIYELLPISVLIGAVFVFARMARTSEYTILRTSGLGPWRALRMLAGLGAVFVLTTFVCGDYLAPASGKAAQLMRAHYQGKLDAGPIGGWLKERRDNRQYSVNVAALNKKGELQGIRIFEFDDQGVLLSRLQAQSGIVATEGHWHLTQTTQTTFSKPGSAQAAVRTQSWPEMDWPTALTAEMVSVALLRPDRMSTTDLYSYVRHLDANGQSAQRYEIEFWRKVFYPLSCMVMLVLALPFAYLHFRSGGIAAYVFTGVMVGISFFLLNNVFGYIGRLNDWRPWLAAASPSLIYSVVSLTAFGWLVLRR